MLEEVVEGEMKDFCVASGILCVEGLKPMLAVRYLLPEGDILSPIDDFQFMDRGDDDRGRLRRTGNPVDVASIREGMGSVGLNLDKETCIMKFLCQRCGEL